MLDEAGFTPALPIAILVSDANGWRKPRRGDLSRPRARRSGLSHRKRRSTSATTLRLDVAGGGEAGLRTAWLVRRIRDPEQALKDHTGPPPHHVIEDLAEVPGLVE